MAALTDVIGYLCEKYPYREELSKARLTKMVYLADWKSCIERDKQLTEIVWLFNHYGPYVDDVYNAAASNPEFEVKTEFNNYGNPKDMVTLARKRTWATLKQDDKKVLDHVIEQTKHLNWSEFIRLVYSTFPVLTGDRYSSLDLRRLARRYKREIPARV